MCFSKESSLITWIVAYCIGFVVLQKGTKDSTWKALFLLTFSLIQLLEAIAWYSIETDNKSLNSNITKIILLALWMQPIVNILCAINLGNTGSFNKIFKYYAIPLFLMLIYALYRIFFTNEQFETIVGPTGHLVWKSEHGIPGKLNSGNIVFAIMPVLYFVGLTFPLYFMEKNAGPLIIMITTVVWSLYNYYKTKEFSSMWCFSAAAMAVSYSLSTLF